MTLLPLAGTILVASLAGSPHCAAMCGGFVCFYAGQDGSARPWSHAAYHGGRLVSYVVLGAIAGALGTGMDALGSATGLHRLAAIASGVTLLLMGVAMLARPSGFHPGSSRLSAALRVPLSAALRAVHAWPPAARGLALGLVTTLLPCGWLYLYATTAAGTGTPLGGAIVMAAFWLGTVPLLAGLGLVAQRTIAPLRRRLPMLSGAALLVLGLLTLSGKFSAVAHDGKTVTCEACRKEAK